MTTKTYITYILPKHWASALMNDDESGYLGAELYEIEQFRDLLTERHGKAFCIDVAADGSDGDHGFMQYHDAYSIGVLACDCTEYMFEVKE